MTGVKYYGTLDEWGNDWNKLTNPNMRFHTVIGSHAYRYGLTYLPADMNTMKSNLLRDNDPIALDKFTTQLNKAAGSGPAEAIKAVSWMLSGIQRVS